MKKVKKVSGSLKTILPILKQSMRGSSRTREYCLAYQLGKELVKIRYDGTSIVMPGSVLGSDQVIIKKKDLVNLSNCDSLNLVVSGDVLTCNDEKIERVCINSSELSIREYDDNIFSEIGSISKGEADILLLLQNKKYNRHAKCLYLKDCLFATDAYSLAKIELVESGHDSFCFIMPSKMLNTDMNIYASYGLVKLVQKLGSVEIVTVERKIDPINSFPNVQLFSSKIEKEKSVVVSELDFKEAKRIARKNKDLHNISAVSFDPETGELRSSNNDVIKFSSTTSSDSTIHLDLNRLISILTIIKGKIEMEWQSNSKMVLFNNGKINVVVMTLAH